MFDFDDRTWWKNVFTAGWRGILREAQQAGLARVEAEAVAAKVLQRAIRELQLSCFEMTASEFKRTLLASARQQIAKKLRSQRNPYYVSEAWREKYSETGASARPQPVFPSFLLR